MCSGSCNQRVKRGSIYYVSPDASGHWCQKCYGGLPQLIENKFLSGGTQVTKKDLLRRRVEEERGEHRDQYNLVFTLLPPPPLLYLHFSLILYKN